MQSIKSKTTKPDLPSDTILGVVYATSAFLIWGISPIYWKAMRAVPALIKAYLRLGGFVGEGAWIDAAFNTTDVCIVVDIARVPERMRALYRGRAPS